MLYRNDELFARVISIAHLHWQKQTVNVPSRAFSALALRVRGYARLTTSKGQITSTPGDVLYMPRGVSYTAEYTEGEVFAIHFLAKEEGDVVENYKVSDKIGIHRLFSDAFSAFSARGSYHEATAALFGILAFLDRDAGGGGSTTPFSLAVSYINRHFKNPELNLSTVCHRVGISSSSLRDKFQKEYGIPPIRYVRKLRIQEAVRLLGTGLYTVEEVSAAAGFSDPKYFSRTIREQYGVPPSALFKKNTSL